MSVTTCLVALAASTCATSFQPLEQPEAPGVDRYSLPNGIRVLAIHIPQAEKQCTFTLLPLSLASDPPGKAQWSHLLEHMMIRSTGAAGLVAGGVEFNGETQPGSMRLDTYAQPDAFRESVEKHARWLSAREIDAAALEREKTLIAMEESSVSQTGVTHKFAVAAWNQIVRHGADHAAVHADVAGATPDAIAAFAAEALAIDETILVATIGPVDPAQVKQAIEETIGALPKESAERAIATAGADPPRSGDLEATWDLPTRHLILWWRLPDASAASHAAAAALEMMVMNNSARSGGVTLPISMFHLPEGPVFLINARLDDADDPAAARKRLIEIVHQQASDANVMAAWARMAGQRLSRTPDFEAQRPHLPERMRPLIEGNWLLMLAQQEFAWGQPLETIIAEFEQLDAAALEPAAKRLREEPDGVLLLLPRDEE